jgi:hypothetical protein
MSGFFARLVFKVDSSPVVVVGNPSSLNLAGISPSLYMCLSQTLFHFLMDEHTQESTIYTIIDQLELF